MEQVIDRMVHRRQRVKGSFSFWLLRSLCVLIFILFPSFIFSIFQSFHFSIFQSSTCLAATYTPDNLPIPYLNNKAHYVSNPDGILSAETVDSLNLWLGQMEQDHGVQTVLAVVERIEGGDTYEFCPWDGNMASVPRNRTQDSSFCSPRATAPTTSSPVVGSKVHCRMPSANALRTTRCSPPCARGIGTRR